MNARLTHGTLEQLRIDEPLLSPSGWVRACGERRGAAVLVSDAQHPGSHPCRGLRARRSAGERRSAVLVSDAKHDLSIA